MAGRIDSTSASASVFAQRSRVKDGGSMSELIYSDDVIVMLGSKIRQTREGGVGQQYHRLTGAWIVADKCDDLISRD